ncbi:hypothetical protein SAMD00019534_080610 [Acytostelium subglobosum LB1]|uniref:hypothetical protein n=1 Tax=Acytostelium subglobosum LB1 TaxID=1410327 RepID=UPI000644AC24|nr:hypothetical protein SAMD00019534_080610 [Acytostelium subglobosum LB1]GAM24886.1 hypothetical protein SAMD00019534_080610 [Acytostelium subglobosum LB1]|eukprot:XP_012751975.1 hypothetical protein SAMD00019534_080610 [Acytostelium subglobosum LB1]
MSAADKPRTYNPVGDVLFTHEEIHKTIKNLLVEYTDSTILAEQLQNSDDAGATEVSFVLDTGTYKNDKLFKDLKARRDPTPLQGPSLSIVNNSLFKEKDWKGISKIGTGSKQKDVNSVGKFGVGFNSVYHITDCPAIVSGDRVYFPDVLGQFFPMSEAGTNGYFIDYESLTRCDDQFAPFQALGCQKGAKSHNGTIIRLALRGSSGKIKEEATTVAGIKTLFERFVKQAPHSLLFLHNLRRLSLKIDGKEIFNTVIDDSSVMERAPKIKMLKDYLRTIEEQIPASVDKRKLRLDMFRELLANQTSYPVLHYRLGVTSTDTRTGSSTSNEWLITQGYRASKDINNIIQHRSMRDKKLIPTGGIAAPLVQDDANFMGRPFCYLPIGTMSTNLPVHLHGYFYTTSSRTEINLSDLDPTDSSYQLVQWNTVILNQIIPHLYHLNLVELKSLQPERSLYSYFPAKHSKVVKIEDKVKPATLAMILESPLFDNEFNQGHHDRLSAFHLLNGLPQCVVQVLRDRNIPCALLPDELLHTLEKYQEFSNHLKYVTREKLCKLLTMLPIKKYNKELMLYMLDEQIINKGLLNDVPLFQNVNGDVVALNKESVLHTTSNERVIKVLSPVLAHAILSKLCLQDLGLTLPQSLSEHYKLESITYITFLNLLSTSFFDGLAVTESDPLPNLDLDTLWQYFGEDLQFRLHFDKLYDLPIFPASNMGKWYALNHPGLLNTITESHVNTVRPLLTELNFPILDKNALLDEPLKNHNTVAVLLTELKATKFSASNYPNKESLLKNFLVSSTFFGNSLSTQYRQLFAALPLFEVYPNKTQKTYATLAGNPCSLSTELGEYTQHLATLYIKINSTDLEFLPQDTAPMLFATFNQAHVLPNITDFATPLQLKAIKLMLLNLKDYNITKLKTIKFVPTQCVTQPFNAPSNMFVHSAHTSILMQANLGHLLISEELSHIDYSYPWYLLSAMTNLDVQRLQDITIQIATTQNDQLFDQFIALLATSGAHDYPDSVFSRHLQNVTWVRVAQLDNQDEYVGLSPFKSDATYVMPSMCHRPLDSYLCFTRAHIADIGNVDMPDNMQRLLFAKPSLQMILDNLRNIAKQVTALAAPVDPSIIMKIVDIIYTEIRQHIATTPKLKSWLAQFKWVWTGQQFISADSVAFKSDRDFTPYLFEIPTFLASHHRPLFKLFDIPDTYDTKRYLLVVSKMEREHHLQPLPEDKLKVVLEILRFVGEKENKTVDVEIPGTDNILYPKNEVLICRGSDNLTVGLMRNGFHKISDDISFNVGKNLGVITDRELLHQGLTDSGFGQEVGLDSTIKNLLKDGYNPSSLMGEMIQNADDSEATVMDIVLDLNDHTGKIPEQFKQHYPKKFFDILGPSITFINNKSMTEKDIKNIQSVGQSKKTKDNSSIGRFGYGFNSVFNITDIPSLVTNDSIYFFDVHQNHFENYMDSKRGKKFSFINRAFIDEMILEPLLPYQKFGLDLVRPFNGTLFRLPMRREVDEQYSFAEWTIDDREKLFKEFINSVENCMLFLPYIKRINFHRMADGECKLVHSITRMDKDDPSVLKGCLHRIEQSRNNAPEPTDIIQMREYMIESPETGNLDTHRWLVGRRVGGDMATELFKQSLNTIGHVAGAKKRLPLGGVALPLDTDKTFKGKAFSTLPMSIDTGLPVHIDGYFETNSARSSIEDNGTFGNESFLKLPPHVRPENMPTLWNIVLYEDIIAPMYVNLMMEARRHFTGSLNDVKRFYSLFPNAGSADKSVMRIINKFKSEASNKQLYVKVGVGSTSWSVCGRKSIVITEREENDPRQLEIANILSLYKAEVLHIPSHLTYFVNGQQLGPACVRDFFTVTPIKDPPSAIHVFNYLIPLLMIDPAQLVGLNILLLENGTLAKIEFRNAPHGNGQDLKILYNREFVEMYPDGNMFVCEQQSRELMRVVGMLGDRLNVCNMSKGEWIVKHVINTLDTKTFEEVLAILDQFIDVYHTLPMAEKINLTKRRLIPILTPHGPKPFVLKMAAELFDPNCEELEPFRAGLAFPPHELSHDKWNDFWSRMKLKRTLDANDLLDQCALVSREFLSINANNSNEDNKGKLVKRAKYLLMQLEVRNLLDNPKYSNMYIVPCKECKIDGALPMPLLSTLKGSVNDKYAELCFTVKHIRATPLSDKPPESTDIARHFFNCLTLAETTWKVGLNAIHKEETIKYIRNAAEAMNRGPKWDIPIPAGLKLPLPKSSLFIPITNATISASDDFPPYFFSFNSHYNLETLKRIGAISKIKVTDVDHLLSRIAGDTQLSEILVKSIVKLIVKFYVTFDRMPFLVTNRSKLLPRDDVFKFEPADSEMSKIVRRLDMDKLPLIHRDLQTISYIADNLHDVSEVVTERLDTVNSKILPPTNQISALNDRLRNPLAIKCCRSILETSRSRFNKKDIEQLVTALSTIRVQLAIVHSKFMCGRTDVTLHPLGSKYIYDRANNILTISKDIDPSTYLIIFTQITKTYFNIEEYSINLLFNINVNLKNVISIMMESFNLQMDEVSLTKEEANPHAGVHGIHYTNDGQNYVLDPLNSFTPGETALLVLGPESKYTPVVVGPLDYELSYFEEFKVYRIGQHLVPSFNLYKVTPTYIDYADRMDQVCRFLREIIYAGVPRHTMDTIMLRLQSHCSDSHQGNAIKSMAAEIIASKKVDIRHHVNPIDLISFGQLSIQDVAPVKEESGDKDEEEDKVEELSNVEKAFVYLVLATTELEEMDQLYISSIGLMSHQVVIKCLKAILYSRTPAGAQPTFKEDSNSIYSLLTSIDDSLCIPSE